MMKAEQVLDTTKFPLEAEEKTKSAVYVGMDCTHATVRKRIFALQAAGMDITGFTFRREKSNKDFVPDWNNVELGVTLDQNYGQRLKALLGALRILVGRRETLRAAKFIYARNFDNAFMAMAAKFLSGSKAKLVYEVPDVQEFFFGTGMRAKIFRALEKFMLKRTALVVASSPGFVTGYFQPMQDFDGKYYVWENKLLADQLPQLPDIEALNNNLPKPEPWILTWHGTLRCPKTMEILSEAARRLGPKIKIYMRGKPTNYPELFRERFETLENVEFGGEYTLPDDLEEIYGAAHFTWCVDYFDPEGNSPLLLPNRVYQGGYLGVVPIGAEGQETGDYIVRNNLGPRLKLPLVDSLVEFFEKLTWEDYVAMRERVLSQREALFIENADDVKKLIAAIDEA